MQYPDSCNFFVLVTSFIICKLASSGSAFTRWIISCGQMPYPKTMFPPSKYIYIFGWLLPLKGIQFFDSVNSIKQFLNSDHKRTIQNINLFNANCETSDNQELEETARLLIIINLSLSCFCLFLYKLAAKPETETIVKTVTICICMRFWFCQ